MARQSGKSAALCAGLGLAVGLTAGAFGQRNLDTQIKERFEVAAYETLRIDNLPETWGGEFFVPVQVGGAEYTLMLSPHSLRSPDFRVIVQDDAGYREIEAPAPTTYRGTVLEVPGSRVSASVINDGLNAMIILDDTTGYYIQPADDLIAGAPSNLHVFFSMDDVTVEERFCANDFVDGLQIAPPADAHPEDGGHVHGDDCNHGDREVGFGESAEDDDTIFPAANSLCEIAFDADYEFYQKNSSSESNTIADIENVMNGVEVIYERDTEIEYLITTIIVRTTSNDPYSSTDPGTLLGQFQNHWNSQQQGVQRDVAHLMTGKNLNGGVIGVAYLGVICNIGSAYGLSESRYTSNYNNRVALTAHEVGHNWNAPHCCGSCSGCSSCRIMCPCLGGCSGIVTSFGTSEINSIVSFRNTRNCLDEAFDMEIAVGDLFAGQTGEFSVTGGTPNSEVRFYYSVRGEDTDACFVSGFNVSLDLQNCVLGLSATTDSNGNGTFFRTIPNIQTPRVIWIQAAQSGLESNLVLTQIN